MLTDYHVHLRPDELDATAATHLSAANAERYRAVAQERGIAELGVAEHVYRFTAALDVWRHPLWERYARDDLDAYCAFVREETDLRLGVEADFLPGREDRMRSLLDARDWDYVIGSIHFLSEGALDDEEHDVWRSARSADHVWATYFEWLAEAAGSGLFDVLAHPDLVKHWGAQRPWPDRDPRFFYEPAVEAIAAAGVAVEVSTAGLRKPVGEIYPAPALLGMLVEAEVPLALSSDAHVPDQLGFRYEEAVALLREHGVRELAVFERRARRMEPLG